MAGIAFGVYGYYRGALRLGLSLAPLLIAGALLWIFGAAVYRIDALRNAGLVWPGLILMLVGLAGGYAVWFIGRRKLPKEVHRNDRVCGSVLGVIISLVVVWLGCVYFVVLSASSGGGGNGGSTLWLARALTTVGAGSDTMMDMVEIASADENVRRQAVADLGLDSLVDLPEMQAVIDDGATQEDLQKAAQGSMTALWRLQKNPHILKLVETEEIIEVVDRHSLEGLAEVVRNAKQNDAGDGEHGG